MMFRFLANRAWNMTYLNLGSHISGQFSPKDSILQTKFMQSSTQVQRSSSQLTRLQSKTGAIFTLRQLTKEDLPVVYRMFDEENWILEKACLQCSFDTDGSGLFVIVNENLEVIGSVGYYLHYNNNASFGLLMLQKKYRKSHIGVVAGKRILTTLKKKDVFGYTWTNMLTIFEEEFPFVSEPTWYNYGTKNSSMHTVLTKTTQRIELLDLCDVSMPDLLEYDTFIHKLPRIQYMKHWLKHRNSTVVVLKDGGEIVGYGVRRLQVCTHLLAPIYANNDEFARMIFSNLLSKTPNGSKIGFVSLLRNSFATELASEYGLLKPGLPIIGAFSKHPIQFDLGKVYAMSSVSFGLC